MGSLALDAGRAVLASGEGTDVPRAPDLPMPRFLESARATCRSWSLFPSNILRFNSLRFLAGRRDVVCCDREMILVDELIDGFPTPRWRIRRGVIASLDHEPALGRFALRKHERIVHMEVVKPGDLETLGFSGSEGRFLPAAAVFRRPLGVSGDPLATLNGPLHVSDRPLGVLRGPLDVLRRALGVSTGSLRVPRDPLGVSRHPSRVSDRCELCVAHSPA
jgi:hypothetical protein